MIKLAIIYWVVLNFLVIVGGVIGWFQLKRSQHRVSHYLARILMADALRGVLSLWGTRRFRLGLTVEPAFMIASVVVITLLTGAIWGWFLYANGFVNGGGWRGLLRKKLKEQAAARHVAEERK